MEEQEKGSDHGQAGGGRSYHEDALIMKISLNSTAAALVM